MAAVPITVADLVKRNATHAATHTPLPTFPEMQTLHLPPPKILIVSCADPRVFPEQIFGLAHGDAVVIRVIAGHPQNAMNDILALDAFLKFSDVVVVHHTDCGSTYFTEELVRSDLKSRCLSHDEGARIDETVFGAVSTSILQNLVDDLKLLRSHPLIRRELAERSHGYMYDIKTGKVEETKA